MLGDHAPADPPPFAVAFEWRRLAHLTLVMGGIAVLGDVLLPTHGVVGFLARARGARGHTGGAAPHRFAHRQELEQARLLLRAAARRRAREPA